MIPTSLEQMQSRMLNPCSLPNGCHRRRSVVRFSNSWDPFCWFRPDRRHNPTEHTLPPRTAPILTTSKRGHTRFGTVQQGDRPWLQRRTRLAETRYRCKTRKRNYLPPAT